MGRSISRHPLYLAAEVLLATLILAAVGARSPFFFFTLGTAALAGVMYGRRGALPFSALLIAAYELVALEGLPSFTRCMTWPASGWCRCCIRQPSRQASPRAS